MSGESPSKEKIADRIKKLLRLGACKTAPEAASAAAMAQKLIEKFKIEKELLEDPEAPEAKVEEFRPREDVIFRFGKSKADSWVCAIATTLESLNGCYGRGSHGRQFEVCP